MDILENKEILIPISMAILLGRTHEGISKRFHLYLWEWLREPAPARGLPEACPVSEWKGIANPLIAGAVCRRIESRDSKQGRLSSLETGWKNCRAASLREEGRKEGRKPNKWIQSIEEEEEGVPQWEQDDEIVLRKRLSSGRITLQAGRKKQEGNGPIDLQ